MRFRICPGWCSMAVALGCVTASSHALGSMITIVDQQQLVANGSNNSGGQVLASRKGQTFTPTLAGVDAIEMRLDGVNAGDSFLLNLRDTDAPGLTGTVLATSSTISFSTTSFSPTTLHFDFTSTIPLTAGHQYAMELVPVTLGGSGTPAFSVSLAISDVYSGGTYFTSSTNQSASVDAWFREGLHRELQPPQVPEPSTFLLTAIGIFGFAGSIQLRKWRRTKPLSAA